MKKENNVFRSLKNLFVGLTSHYFLGSFFFLCAIEAAAVFLHIVLLPVDPKNSLVLGLSSQRILLLAGVLSYFLISAIALFCVSGKGEKLFPLTLMKKLDNTKILCSSLFIFILTLWALLLPETGLRGQYRYIFEKIDPIFLLIALFTFQVASLIAILHFKSISPEERKQRINHLLNRYAIPLIVFFFPFLFFFPRTIPINGEFFGIANDFIPTSYTYKVYLLDCLSHFHLPLWSPSEAAGFPFFSNPFSQFFYPLNIPQTLLYRLNGGYSILDHQRYSILGISIFALGIYYWLKQFDLSSRSIFIASLLIPVSYRLADLIRYPSGMHSIAWYPWILYSLTRISYEKSTKKLILNAAILFYSCFSLITAGYQYYLYYSLFLFFPYLLLLWIPPIRRLFFREPAVYGLKNLLTLGLTGLSVFVVCGPFVLRMMRLLSKTVARGGDDYAFSTMNDFNFIDSLGSLVYPPVSQTEGWYYFGFACLIIAIMYLISSPFLKYETWATPDKGKTWDFWYLNKFVKGILFGWVVIISYISYGHSSHLFNFLWTYLPYFSRMRYLSRINILLIPVLALLIAISLDWINEVFFVNKKTVSKSRRQLLTWSIAICCIYVFLLGIQTYLFFFQETDKSYWQVYFYIFDKEKHWFLINGLIAFVFILATLNTISVSKNKLLSGINFWLFLLSIVTITDIWRVSAFCWWNGTMQTDEDIRRPVQIYDRVLMESFSFRRDGTFFPPKVSLKPVYYISYNDSWYYENYRQFYKKHEYESDARNELLGVKNGNRIFFSKSISHQTITDFLNDSRELNNEYEIIEFTGNKLKIRLLSSDDGYISYVDNWDPDWKAYIDGNEVPLERLFETFKSVRIHEGDTVVIFSYEPSLWP